MLQSISKCLQTCLENYKLPYLYVALSGGVDSMVLLTLVQNYLKSSSRNLKIKVIHINHQVNIEADNWQKFVQNHCQKNNIELYVGKLTIDKKISEENLRKERYQLLVNLSEEKSIVLTAHHLDDEIETKLFKIFRGNGYYSIEPLKQCLSLNERYFIRPLLTLDKKQIYNYAIENQLKWVEDDSNKSNIYSRNYIRNQIIPNISQYFTHFKINILNYFKEHNENLNYLNNHFEKMLDSLILAQYPNHCIFDLTQICQKTEFEIKKILNLICLKQFEIIPTQKKILTFMQFLHKHYRADNTSQKEFQISKNNFIFIVKNKLYAVNKIEQFKPKMLLLDKNNTVQTPYGIVQINEVSSGLPLPSTIIIRQVQNSDALILKRGKQNIKKIFQEFHIPKWLRGYTPVICDDENFVLSVAGLKHNSIKPSKNKKYQIIWQTEY